MAELFEAEVVRRTRTVQLKGTPITYLCVDEEHKQLAKFVPLVNWNSDNALVDRFDTLFTRFGKEPSVCSVIELGSGLGLPSIFIAKSYPFHDVHVNDGDPTSIEFITHNIAANSPYCAQSIEVLEFMWFSNTAGLIPVQNRAVTQKYDFVLGSDVIYDPESLRALIFTISSLLKADGVCILQNFYSRFYKNEAAFHELVAQMSMKAEVTALGGKGETIECILRHF